MDEALIALEKAIAELKKLLQPGVTIDWPGIATYVALIVIAKSELESQEVGEAYDLMLKRVARLVNVKTYQQEFLFLLDSDAQGVFKSYLVADGNMMIQEINSLNTAVHAIARLNEKLFSVLGKCQNPSNPIVVAEVAGLIAQAMFYREQRIRLMGSYKQYREKLTEQDRELMANFESAIEQGERNCQMVIHRILDSLTSRFERNHFLVLRENISSAVIKQLRAMLIRNSSDPDRARNLAGRLYEFLEPTPEAKQCITKIENEFNAQQNAIDQTISLNQASYFEVKQLLEHVLNWYKRLLITKFLPEDKRQRNALAEQLIYRYLILAHRFSLLKPNNESVEEPLKTWVDPLVVSDLFITESRLGYAFDDKISKEILPAYSEARRWIKPRIFEIVSRQSLEDILLEDMNNFVNLMNRQRWLFDEINSELCKEPSQDTARFRNLITELAQISQGLQRYDHVIKWRQAFRDFAELSPHDAPLKTISLNVLERDLGCPQNWNDFSRPMHRLVLWLIKANQLVSFLDGLSKEARYLLRYSIRNMRHEYETDFVARLPLAEKNIKAVAKEIEFGNTANRFWALMDLLFQAHGSLESASHTNGGIQPFVSSNDFARWNDAADQVNLLVRKLLQKHNNLGVTEVITKERQAVLSWMQSFISTRTPTLYLPMPVNLSLKRKISEAENVPDNGEAETKTGAKKLKKG